MAGNKEAERALALFDGARASRAQGDLRGAVAKLKESVALFPNEASLAMLGDDLLREGRYAEAIVYLAAGLGLGESTELRLSIARAFTKIGSRSDALQQLRTLLKRQPQHPAAREQLKTLLRDPAVIAETARRHRILDALHQAVPDVPFGREAWPVDALKQVAVHVLFSTESPDAAGRPDIVRLFEFFNQLAIHPDPDVADLVMGAVYPELAEWTASVELARQLLTGRARRAFEDAVALWGPPKPEPPSLSSSSLIDYLKLTIPRFSAGAVDIGVALARQISEIVERAPDLASSPEVSSRFMVLSRMAVSQDAAVLKSFFTAIQEIIASRLPAAIQLARRSLTGPAQAAIERELGWQEK